MNSKERAIAATKHLGSDRIPVGEMAMVPARHGTYQQPEFVGDDWSRSSKSAALVGAIHRWLSWARATPRDELARD